MSQSFNAEWRASSTNDIGKMDIYMKWMKLDPSLMLYTKINAKLIKDLNLRAKMMKLLKENIKATFMTLALSMIFKI